MTEDKSKEPEQEKPKPDFEYKVTLVMRDTGNIDVGFTPGKIIDMPIVEVRNTIQQALTQLNQDIIVRTVISNVQKMLSNGNIIKPGFRPGFFGKLMGKK